MHTGLTCKTRMYQHAGTSKQRVNQSNFWSVLLESITK